MLLPNVLYALFALLTVAGTYLMVAPLRGRGPALAGSGLVLLFFVVLALSLRLLLVRAGAP